MHTQMSMPSSATRIYYGKKRAGKHQQTWGYNTQKVCVGRAAWKNIVSRNPGTG